MTIKEVIKQIDNEREQETAQREVNRYKIINTADTDLTSEIDYCEHTI